MDISSCFSIPENRLVHPQTEYERDCNAAFINASSPILKKKSSFEEPTHSSKKKKKDIILDGKPHFNLEEAVDNDELV